MGKKAPKAPDPAETAAAQGAVNQQTAITQQLLGMTDQVTPTGSLTYTQTGTRTYTDPATGKVVKLPAFTATQSYTPTGMQTIKAQEQAGLNFSNLARDKSAQLGQLLSAPFSLNNEATEARINELGSKRLDPQFARDEEALRTRLINSGVRPGTAAFDAEFNNFSQAKNDARNQLLLNARQQAQQEMLTERSQPINEISALLSGSQVNAPNFVNTPQPQVAGVDYAGQVNNAYNQQMAARNSSMGGLFGLLGAGITGGATLLSDRRAKEDIKKVGKLDNGLPVYTYRYKGSETPQIGLMAQDVKKKNPAAVEQTSFGLMAVNYGKAVQNG